MVAEEKEWQRHPFLNSFCNDEETTITVTDGPRVLSSLRMRDSSSPVVGERFHRINEILFLSLSSNWKQKKKKKETT